MWLEVLCAVLAVCWIRVAWRRWRYDLHKIPSPPSWPLLGQTLDFAFGQAGKQQAIWMRHLLEPMGYPKIMRLEVAGEALLVVSDIEYVTSVVLSKTAPFPRVPTAKRIFHPLAGCDDHTKFFVTTPKSTPYVKSMRKLYATAFQSNNLRKAMPKLNGVMQKMFDVIESKRHEGPIDFQNLCVQFTLDTIGVVALDVNLGGLDGSRQIKKKVIDTGHEARGDVAIPFRALYCKHFPNSKVAQRQTRIYNELRHEYDILAQEILTKDPPPEGEMPLWYAVKTFIDPETEKPLPYDSLRTELAAIVVGGMDTTGHQLAWTLGMLASHPEVTDKLLKELQQNGLYGEDARDVTFEDLEGLKYLSAVIKEGMRIAHIGMHSMMRTVPEDMKILGYRVPKGTVLMTPSNRSMCSEADWGDPDVVRPERWLTDEDMSSKYFHIFSMGPRDCVGQRLAMLEIRFAILKLVTKYKLSMDISFDELLHNTVDGLAVEAKDGIMLNASPREVSEAQI